MTALSANVEGKQVRLDKWLWCARFYKTRSMARTAVVGGRVHVNGQRTKAGHGLRVGDRLNISKAGQLFEIEVRALARRRRPAARAQALYAESSASQRRREHETTQRKAAHLSTPVPHGRPDKKDRRALLRYKRDGH